MSLFAPRYRKRFKRTLRRIAGFALRGDALECACCGRGSRRFLSFGNPPRKNAMCAHCGSLERHRFLWLYLDQTRLLDATSPVLLHVAPEYAVSRRLNMMKNVRHVSVDLHDDEVSVRCNLESLPFDERSFDGVICYHVLEHVNDDRKSMREMYRVTARGGWAMIGVPHSGNATTTEDPAIADPSERRRLFGQEDHVRLYGLDYFDRLREAGFTVDVKKMSDVIPVPVLRKNGMDGQELFAVCRR